MNRKKSLHNTLQERIYGRLSTGSVFRIARGSKSFVQRLQRDHTLSGHSGCVNTISWSESGELLLSGSDDCKLNIYKPVAKKLVHSIRSGHRANVFSAKFLPCTGNRGIVSCAGDGMIQYTDVERETTYGQYQFNCHSGTTYDVVTTPADPNTFLTCGEDGTVRLFDLRTKTKCSCRECKDDVLLDCGKAVTSISVNPTTPFHLAVGCEDSIVRVFDRRTLTTNLQSSSDNKLQGLFSQFKPESLKDRMCRVTSLQYSDDGSELLVSYCADYVYLFSMVGKQMVYSRYDETDRTANGFHSVENGAQRNVPPLKRLRLRGDWSDTGPNARPESEHPSEESSLMQRMSDMFARWLEESFRAGQRRRAQSSQHRSSSSSSSSSSDSSASHASASLHESSSSSFDSGSMPGLAVEESSSLEQLQEMQSDLSADESNSSSVQADVCGSKTGSASENMNNVAPANSQSSYCHTNTSGFFQDAQPHLTEESECVDLGDLEDTRTNSDKVFQQTTENLLKSNTNNKAEKTSCNNCTDSEFSTSLLCTEQYTEQQSTSAENFEQEEEISQTSRLHQYSDRKKAKAESSLNSKCSDSRINIDSRTESGFVSQRRAYFESIKKQDIRSDSPVKAPDCNLKKSSEKDCKCENTLSNNTAESFNDCTFREQQQDVPSTGDLPSVHVEQVDCGLGDSADEMETSETQTEYSTGLTSQGGICTKGETTAGPQVDQLRAEDKSRRQDIDCRNDAATRIQRMFRQRKMYKSLSDNKKEVQEYWVPEMIHMFKGHRNARTMIKEANFWGDHHVISGSDCGRIFIWNKYTAEIVAILQGDRHVVNCVQPHPFDPVLASSGIDYDIKIWAPIATEPIELTDADEIVRRNEKMLEESRDTITVPASFMLRMLASLNHSRFTRRNQDNDSDSDSSDD